MDSASSCAGSGTNPVEVLRRTRGSGLGAAEFICLHGCCWCLGCTRFCCGQIGEVGYGLGPNLEGRAFASYEHGPLFGKMPMVRPREMTVLEASTTTSEEQEQHEHVRSDQSSYR